MSLSQEELQQLLVVTEVVTRPATLEELKARLDHYKTERDTRIKIRGNDPRFGKSLSDQWLQQTIGFLETAITAFPKTS